MPAPDNEPMKRTHIWLYARDIQALHELFDTSVGFSTSVRMIVHQYLNCIRARAEAVAMPVPLPTNYDLQENPSDDHQPANPAASPPGTNEQESS